MSSFNQLWPRCCERERTWKCRPEVRKVRVVQGGPRTDHYKWRTYFFPAIGRKQIGTWGNFTRCKGGGNTSFTTGIPAPCSKGMLITSDYQKWPIKGYSRYGYMALWLHVAMATWRYAYMWKSDFLKATAPTYQPKGKCSSSPRIHFRCKLAVCSLQGEINGGDPLIHFKLVFFPNLDSQGWRVPTHFSPFHQKLKTLPADPFP